MTLNNAASGIARVAGGTAFGPHPSFARPNLANDRATPSLERLARASLSGVGRQMYPASDTGSTAGLMPARREGIEIAPCGPASLETQRNTQEHLMFSKLVGRQHQRAHADRSRQRRHRDRASWWFCLRLNSVACSAFETRPSRRHLCRHLAASAVSSSPAGAHSSLRSFRLRTESRYYLAKIARGCIDLFARRSAILRRAV